MLSPCAGAPVLDRRPARLCIWAAHEAAWTQLHEICSPRAEDADERTHSVGELLSTCLRVAAEMVV
jgi:hypothetical protein